MSEPSEFVPDLPRHWTPAAQQKFLDQMAVTERPKAWFCRTPGRTCDGNPHDAYDYQHARSDQWPPPIDDHSWQTWLLAGGRGSGKALAMDTPIPTPGGWRKMADLAVGDEVFDQAGQITRITAVYDRMPTKAYRLTFDDGTHLDACDEHQWVTWDQRERSVYAATAFTDNNRFPARWPQWRSKHLIGPRLRTTADLVASGGRHSIPTTGPLRLPNVDLGMPAYRLGQWLADPGLDIEGVTTGQLATLGCLDGRHIPTAALRASVEQRAALMTGLMDTSGHIDPRSHRVKFSTTRLSLADDVVELTRSLGFKPELLVTNRPDTGRVATVSFRPTRQVFRAQEIRARAVSGIMRRPHATKAAGRMIVSFEEIPNEPMRCITVDSPCSMYLAGEGMIPTHNTRAGAEWLRHLTRYTPRLALISPTAADLRDTLIEGESGILRVCERAGYMPVWEPSKRRLTFPNGAIAIGYTAEEPDRLRGRNDGAAWVDEAAHYPNVEYVWSMLQFGLRMPGITPRVCVTTTPTPSEWLRALIGEPSTRTATVSTFANAVNLSPAFIAEIERRYAGTRLGRQELYAEILEDVEGALWSGDILDLTRKPVAPELTRVIVGVDPAGTSRERSDETGIIVVGVGYDEHLYILADYSGRYTPQEWALNTYAAAADWNADCIVAETNYGGEMVRTVLDSVARPPGADLVRVKMVSSRKGKLIRAEPVFALFEQDKAHVVGHQLGVLETQLCSWVPGKGKSPDRLDAMVHAAIELTGAGVSDLATPTGQIVRTKPSSPAKNQLKKMVRGVLYGR